MAKETWIRIPSKPFRKEIHMFFYREEWKYETSITDVRAYKKGNAYKIVVTTHLPGLFIGTAGCFIDLLRDYLKEEFGKEVEIILRKCQLWHNLFKN